MNDRILKYGIVGCGRIAHRHAGEIQKRGILVGVYDIEREKSELFARKFSTKTYDSFQAMLAARKEMDVIVICTPNGLHAKHSVSALNAGFHVLCEKPMALTSEDCKRMVEASENSHCQLIIVKQNRFNPAVVSVKKALDEGLLGRILSFQLSCFWNRGEAYYLDSWHGKLAMDGGTLFTQFSHFIDILQWYFGVAGEATGFFSNSLHKGLIEFEDTGVVILKFPDGIIGTLNYTVNSYSENMEGSLTIFAENGTVKIGGEYLNKIAYQNLKTGTIQSESEQGLVNDYGSYRGSMSNHGQVYDNLTEVILHGAAVSVSAADGLRTVEMIERIYRNREF